MGRRHHLHSTTARFLYLATYIDVFSRKVVGWAMKTRMTEQLVIDAFLRAIGREQPPAGLIVHADRGSQYTSRRYQETVKRHGGVIMSRPGDPYDNAVMEAFYKTLKAELLPGGKFVSVREAENAVFEYIECFTTANGCILLWAILRRSNTNTAIRQTCPSFLS
ncbi:DDE-type integrase/transposase/recombinase [Alicyclobacillus kakegawensis]|uniref:DDE-type integrase/transposase/recombinase n=1 Tax=Alicyclobacillus kakegawensis TaxID=392012 RepID=UPI0009F976DE|nr:DDE-type integrase/transposase/recombinase [Alicyclobacillus kakegawensis]